MSTQPIPTRSQIKQLQKSFIASCSSSMQKISTFLQNRLTNAILQCQSSQCVNRLTPQLNDVQFETIRFMDTISNGLEKCISIQGNKGIKGYKKCFLMYQYLMKFQVEKYALLNQ